MTRVEFFFNVENKLEKIAELCEKAIEKGHQLTIFSQDVAVNDALEQQLWQHSATSFLVNSKANEAMSHFSAIVIAENSEYLLQDDILINLQTEYPPFFSRFRHLVELVSNDAADKVAARSRFRFYRDRGYDIKSTDTAENK
ncbi:MAG: DNA polymerase III subunit chi [Methylotenera sp.]|nr:DNA polymerase III subunit chi [Methylotenera sp.]